MMIAVWLLVFISIVKYNRCFIIRSLSYFHLNLLFCISLYFNNISLFHVHFCLNIIVYFKSMYANAYPSSQCSNVIDFSYSYANGFSAIITLFRQVNINKRSLFNVVTQVYYIFNTDGMETFSCYL